jgi:hypothetical protein
MPQRSDGTPPRATASIALPDNDVNYYCIGLHNRVHSRYAQRCTVVHHSTPVVAAPYANAFTSSAAVLSV